MLTGMPPLFVHKKKSGFPEVVADQSLSYAGFFALEISPPQGRQS